MLASYDIYDYLACMKNYHIYDFSPVSHDSPPPLFFSSRTSRFLWGGFGGMKVYMENRKVVVVFFYLSIYN